MQLAELAELTKNIVPMQTDLADLTTKVNESLDTHESTLQSQQEVVVQIGFVETRDFLTWLGVGSWGTCKRDGHVGSEAEPSLECESLLISGLVNS